MKAIGKTPVYWIVRIVLSLAIVFILSACAARPPLPAEEGTPTPTLIPTLAPTATRESTPTSRPTEIVVSKFTSTLVGVSPEFARKLDAEGINKSLNDDGTIKSVTVGYNPDGTAIVEKDVKIVDAGINFQTDFQGNILKDANGKPISQDIHNLGYVNGIATVVDEQGRALHWNETGKEWVASLPINTLANATTYPDGREDLVIETILLNPELNKPFPEVENFKPLAVVVLEGERNSAHAFLYSEDPNSIRFIFDKNGNPIFFQTTTNGIVYKSTPIQFRPKKDKSMFALSDSGMWADPNDAGFGGLNSRQVFEDEFLPNAGGWKGILPLIEIASRGDFFNKISLPTIDPLLNSPKNINMDLLKILGFSDTQTVLQKVIDGEIPSNTPFYLESPQVQAELMKIQSRIWGLSFTVNQ